MIERALAALLSTSLVVSLVPATAIAAPARGDAAAKPSVRKLLAEGEAALKQKDYPKAVDRFRQADAAQPSTATRLGLARALTGTGQLVRAEEAYNSLFKDPALTPSARQAGVIKKEEGLLSLRLPFVTLSVTGVDAATATVSLDNETLPAGGWSSQRAVDPGAHVARAEAPGYAAVQVPFTADEGKATTVVLPFAAPLLPAKPAEDEKQARQGHSVRRTIGWALVGVGGAGLVVGGIAGALAIHQHGVLTSECTASGICPRTHTSDVENYHSLGTVSTVGLVAGGALAAVGVVLVILPSKKTSDAAPVGTSALSIRPTIAPGLVGTNAEWRF